MLLRENFQTWKKLKFLELPRKCREIWILKLTISKFLHTGIEKNSMWNYSSKNFEVFQFHVEKSIYENFKISQNFIKCEIFSYFGIFKSRFSVWSWKTSNIFLLLLFIQFFSRPTNFEVFKFKIAISIHLRGKSSNFSLFYI